MTLTLSQFMVLRASCLYKKGFKLELNALAHCASMQARPPRRNVKRDKKPFSVYECKFCRCFHVGHKGSMHGDRPTFEIRSRKIVLAPCEILG